MWLDSESEFSDQELDWEEDDVKHPISKSSLNAFEQLRYIKEADSVLRGLYGNGSKRETVSTVNSRWRDTPYNDNLGLAIEDPGLN